MYLKTTNHTIPYSKFLFESENYYTYSRLLSHITGHRRSLVHLQ